MSTSSRHVCSVAPEGAVVDVVVVSYNNREQIRGCVESLASRDEVSVIVVDNASKDESLNAVADLKLTRVALRRNVGFGSGCNVGWRAGSAPYVLFLNPDARISAEDLAMLIRALEGAGAGVAAPRIHRGDGSLDWSLRRFPQVRSILGQALFAHRLAPHAAWVDEVIREPHQYERAHTCEWASGACLLVRRDLLERLDGFDETFFMYCEDVDLCRRAWDAGESVFYTPDARCVHAGGASSPRADLVPILAQSRVRYARKHFTPAKARAYRLGLGLVALTHSLLSRTARSRLGYARSLAQVVRG